jgi:hypothetical protein
MKRILQSPISWAVLVFMVIFAASYLTHKKENTNDSFRVWTQETSPDGEAGYALLRPFVSPIGTYSIAMEGGRQPIFAIEVPSVTLGPADDCSLQILLIGDWDTQTTRDIYRTLETMYREDHANALPSLALYLLPGTAGAASAHFMEWIIAVHFVANQVTTLPTFLKEISAGLIATDDDIIRKRLEEIEPQIVSRIDPFLQTQKPIMEKPYLIAQAQMRLNEKSLQCTEATQLVSMKQILTGSPGRDPIKAFLLLAKAQQDAFLASPAGVIPLEPKHPR